MTLEEFLDALKRNLQGEFYNKYVKGIRAIDAAGNVRVIDPYDDQGKIRNMFVVHETGRGAGKEDLPATQTPVPPAQDADGPAKLTVGKTRKLRNAGRAGAVP